ncbi:MAG: NifU family protein [Actinobacteria bacterium]|nr:NifU family protein [Actinomycetota bacterium]
MVTRPLGAGLVCAWPGRAEPRRAGFRPAPPRASDDDPPPAVAAVLAAAAAQMARDGGGLRLQGRTRDGYLRLELTGACARCPRAMMTLDLAIESPLRATGTGLRGVELV